MILATALHAGCGVDLQCQGSPQPRETNCSGRVVPIGPSVGCLLHFMIGLRILSGTFLVIDPLFRMYMMFLTSREIVLGGFPQSSRAS